jgi:glycosyltransferase involved in cell wall biosynthesis
MAATESDESVQVTQPLSANIKPDKMHTQEFQIEKPGLARDAAAHQTRTRSVLFVTSTPGYGGTEKHLLELLSRLEGSNVQSIILCADKDPYTERLNGSAALGVTVRREANLKTVWDWRAIFREIKPDVVVFVYGWIWCIPSVASVGARMAGIRKRYSIQHLIPPPLKAMEGDRTFYNVLRHLAGRNARRRMRAAVPPRLFNKTICVSNAVRDSLIRDYRFPSRRTLTVHNGVSISEFAPSDKDRAAVRGRLGIRSDEFVLVCSSRLSEEKGVDIVLLALRKLLDRNLACKCIIVGDGHLREKITEQVRELGLASHVFMEGFQTEVKPYLCAGDVFTLTSYREGLPFAVLEAMACGLPCVVTNVGGNAEAVIQNSNGLVVNAGSVDEVVEAISFLMSHPEERAQMSRVARVRACEEFDIETRMAEIKRVILKK